MVKYAIMKEILKLLEKVDDFDRLKTEVIELVEKYSDDRNQLICQNLDPNNIDWFAGIGSIDDLEERNEKSYRFINPMLQGTLLESIILKYDAYRSRIMIMPPRRCYSVHADPTKRIHLPIVTNSQCWMIWPHNNRCFYLPAGNVFLTDTTQPHTFINGSKTENRIHVVMCID